MARRGMTGQLNMFDFFRELETNIPQDGELEMVSLMPSFEEDEMPVSSVERESVTDVVEDVEEKKDNTKNKAKNKTKNGTKEMTVSQREKIETSKIPETIETVTTHDRPVMQRTYTTKQGAVEIAYMNYSKVRVSEPGQEAQIKEFASSKEAVDYYVEQMQKLEELYARDN